MNAAVKFVKLRAQQLSTRCTVQFVVQDVRKQTAIVAENTIIGRLFITEIN